MNSTEYKIKPGNITSNSEETSSVSKISYEIENANHNQRKKRPDIKGFKIKRKKKARTKEKS